MELRFIFVFSLWITTARSLYKIGIGIADVTGPAAGVTFLGYGKVEQTGEGIHLRQFSRAFLIEDSTSRTAFVSIDSAMMGDHIKKDVLKKLNEKLPGLYDTNNLMLSSTHTHSTPGGYMLHMLFDLSTMGYVQQTLNCLVKGITLSILRAHDKLDYGRIFINKGELNGISMSRSPQSYLLNPEAERAQYEHNVDKTMVQLRFESESGMPLGVINWYAVHATSMNNTNRLVSSDNVGYASVLFEQKMNPESFIGKGRFVAAFASSNLGDVTPNIKGPRCQKSGKPCDIPGPSCDANELCVASGPGDDMKESTRIIAQQLFDRAYELMVGEPITEIKGPINAIHQFVDMTTEEVDYTTPRGQTIKGKGCKPAMGHTFSSGTIDGPGLFSFEAGSKSSNNPLWDIVTNFVPKPSLEQVKCHEEKSILISTGEFNYPLAWSPKIVSTQLAVIGQLVIACVPGEFTTMSGRRVRKAIRDVLCKNSWCTVVIAGLCNTYSDYITTPEEYKLQRYEGASTLFGPYTLPIYLKQYSKLAKALLSGNKKLGPGPEPVDLRPDVWSLLPSPMYDTPTSRHSFGDCIEQPPYSARWGQTVKAKFVSGNPRNNPMLEMTFLTVERLTDDFKWDVVATDANWETEFTWKTVSWFWASSVAEIKWTIPENTTPGLYRIRHFGYFKNFGGGKLGRYFGTSETFKVMEK
ncbi:neutral ceramidase isoform X1 [Rhopalosiphum padi]|uniref:neutral ceramidase isoform X1 n=2 Tax=Rhopalosiphum padi TaxID=40932 RepID=UPI00298E697A|nr:neutral ceramidase isoform X1 [Rhopalosiphum padi]